jgi:hypothetical protein
MRLELEGNLPFVAVTVGYRGAEGEIGRVLIDTGSASTLLSVDTVSSLGLFPMPKDILHTIRGIGGSEVVFSRRVDYFRVGGRSLPDFEVEIGGMDYGFEINGILGMDFLTRAAAVLDLGNLTIEFSGAGT